MVNDDPEKKCGRLPKCFLIINSAEHACGKSMTDRGMVEDLRSSNRSTFAHQTAVQDSTQNMQFISNPQMNSGVQYYSEQKHSTELRLVTTSDCDPPSIEAIYRVERFMIRLLRTNELEVGVGGSLQSVHLRPKRDKDRVNGKNLFFAPPRLLWLPHPGVCVASRHFLAVAKGVTGSRFGVADQYRLAGSASVWIN